jgi:hypothetical protein
MGSLAKEILPPRLAGRRNVSGRLLKALRDFGRDDGVFGVEAQQFIRIGKFVAALMLALVCYLLFLVMGEFMFMFHIYPSFTNAMRSVQKMRQRLSGRDAACHVPRQWIVPPARRFVRS